MSHIEATCCKDSFCSGQCLELMHEYAAEKPPQRQGQQGLFHTSVISVVCAGWLVSNASKTETGQRQL